MTTRPNPLLKPRLKHVAPVNPVISRGKLLEKAAKCLELRNQWAENGTFDNALRYETQAEVIIEILEVDDCGSVGGFDKKRQQPSTDRLHGRDRLEDRLNWLMRLPEGETAETELKRLREQLDKIK